MKIQVSFVSWCLVGCCRLEGGHRSSYICFNEQPIKRLPISGSPVWRDHGVWWEITFWQIKVWKSIRDSLHFNKKPFKNPYCCSSGCFCPAEKTDAHVWGCPLFTFMSTGVRPKTVLMCDWTLPSHLHTHMFTLPTYVDTQKLPDFLLWVHKVFFLSGPSFDLLTTDWR